MNTLSHEKLILPPIQHNKLLESSYFKNSMTKSSKYQFKK